MKNFIKKSTSILLVFVMLFSFAQVGFAAEAVNNDVATVSDNDNEIVATFSLMSCMYFYPVSGHTWLYVENISDEPIQVGLYTVPVGEGVSVGCFAFTSRDGWGIYYNLEAYREYMNDNYDDHWSITKTLTRKELEKVSDDIANYLNYWGFYFNCAYFSFSIWNANSNDFLIPLVIPAISQLEVIANGGQKGVLKMYAPRRDQVFRQKGSRDNAYLIPAPDSADRY